MEVTVPENEAELEITGVGLSAESPIPNSGRVVLYITPIVENGREGNSIAIAPLTIGKSEIVKVDFIISPSNSIILSTKGDPIDVTVTGFIDSLGKVITQIL